MRKWEFLYFADFTKNHLCQLVQMSLVWYLNEVFKKRWYCPTNGTKKFFSKIDFNTPMLKFTLVKKWWFIGIIQIFDILCFLSVQNMVYLPYAWMEYICDNYCDRILPQLFVFTSMLHCVDCADGRAVAIRFGVIRLVVRVQERYTLGGSGGMLP